MGDRADAPATGIAGTRTQYERGRTTGIMSSGHRRRRSPGIAATFAERYEARTLVPRAKQAPRRIPVRWYPTHGYQHEQPSHLQAPSSLMARGPRGSNSTRDPTMKIPLDSGSHINAHAQRTGREPRAPIRWSVRFDGSRPALPARL